MNVCRVSSALTPIHDSISINVAQVALMINFMGIALKLIYPFINCKPVLSSVRVDPADDTCVRLAQHGYHRLNDDRASLLHGRVLGYYGQCQHAEFPRHVFCGP